MTDHERRRPLEFMVATQCRFRQSRGLAWVLWRDRLVLRPATPWWPPLWPFRAWCWTTRHRLKFGSDGCIRCGKPRDAVLAERRRHQRAAWWSWWRVLVAADVAGHAACYVAHRPLPLPLYRLCCYREAVHDRLWPDACRCCIRPPRPDSGTDNPADPA